MYDRWRARRGRSPRPPRARSRRPKPRWGSEGEGPGWSRRGATRLNYPGEEGAAEAVGWASAFSVFGFWVGSANSVRSSRRVAAVGGQRERFELERGVALRGACDAAPPAGRLRPLNVCAVRLAQRRVQGLREEPNRPVRC
jgi:hypothetical protein